MASKHLILLLFILIGVSPFMLERAIDVAPPSSTSFSAENTRKHIEKMASETHLMGTTANKKVKDYILNEFKKLNVETEIFIGNTHGEYSASYKRFGRTENIIATIKGNNPTKALVLCAHYDSVLEGPGAADDIHAVACMIEIARLLKDKSYQNDIVFLITDGEEMGLFGAKAYSEVKDLSNIGLILNYEARGNTGPSISFEWSNENGWLVRQLKKVGKKPIASSLSYEIYKLLPNNTDYSNFKPKGIPGINHAFIEGFSYYHNPEDNPENLSYESVQHTGENMYRLTQHFANQDLNNVKAPNASFFNLFGSLVIYPSAWDQYIVAITIFCLLVLLFFKRQANKIKFRRLFGGLVLLLIAMGLVLAFSYLIGFLTMTFYPQYNEFYSGQFYNHSWYLGAVTGSTIFIFWGMINLITKKLDAETLKASGILLLALFVPLAFSYIPTGVYIITLPLLLMILFSILTDFYIDQNKKSFLLPLRFGTSALAIALWVPLTYSIFLAFSLKLLLAPSLVVFLICTALVISDNRLFAGKLFGLLGFALFLVGALGGHFTSSPTANKPIPSDLIYSFNATTGNAHWATLKNQLNIGNQKLLNGAKNIQLVDGRTQEYLAVANSIKPHIALSNIEYDTTSNTIRIIRPEESFMTRFILHETGNLKQVTINDYDLGEGRKNNGLQTIDVYGITSDTLKLTLNKSDLSIPQKITISNRYHSLPIEDIIPSEARRSKGYSDIMQDISI